MPTENLRIPFAEAIAERRLLGMWWRELSFQQRVALKAVYGCELSKDVVSDDGWSELDIWAQLQENCEYDELGFLTKVHETPYVPQEYPEAWLVVGVRGGKTDRFAATITAYEATCGGHEAFVRGKGRPVVCFDVAQDLRMARYSLHSIKAIIESMPWAMSAGWITNVTADRIDLKNNVTIATTPPTVKSIRGYDSPVGVGDECGVWWSDLDSANPDIEIFRQLSSRQAQFEFPKLVGISSPWSKVGLLYQRWQAGTNGTKLVCDRCKDVRRENCPECERIRMPHKGRLILHSTSAGLGNPLIRRPWLQAQLNADPANFRREYLAEFQDSLSGFLPSELVDRAVDRGTLERPPAERNVYIAAMDPAFRQDTFAFTIVHMDPQKGVVQDVVRQWKPMVGMSLNPAEILPEIGRLLKQYRTFSVYSDQFQFEALLQLAYQHGFSIEGVDFTATSKADIYGNLKSLVAQGRIRLLDDADTVRELKQLEMQLTAGGGVRIAAPRQAHDDLATVVALAAQKAIWMFPVTPAPAPAELTLEQRCQEQVRAKVAAQLQQQQMGADDMEDW